MSNTFVIIRQDFFLSIQQTTSFALFWGHKTTNNTTTKEEKLQTKSQQLKIISYSQASFVSKLLKQMAKAWKADKG